MHHIFVKKDNIYLDKNIIVVSDIENVNHLVNALRVKKTEKVLCSCQDFLSSFDYLTEIIDISNENITLQIIEKTNTRELPTKIILYQSICKMDKLETIIEKAVELGVYEINIITADFSIIKLDEKKQINKIERLSKIAKSAAEQCRRSIIPKINNISTFDDIINSIDGDETILFYENEEDINKTKQTLEILKNKNINKINIIIGPEGGFSIDEINKAKSKNVNILSLGKRILRTETASIVGIFLMMYSFEN